MGIVLRQFTLATATILNTLLSIYFWILLAAAVLSWVNPDPNNPIVRFLRAVTDPVLYRVRRALPFVYAGGIDDIRSTNPADIKRAKNYVRAAMGELLAGKPVSDASTRPYGCSIKY